MGGFLRRNAVEKRDIFLDLQKKNMNTFFLSVKIFFSNIFLSVKMFLIIFFFFVKICFALFKNYCFFFFFFECKKIFQTFFEFLIFLFIFLKIIPKKHKSWLLNRYFDASGFGLSNDIYLRHMAEGIKSRLPKGQDIADLKQMLNGKYLRGF